MRCGCIADLQPNGFGWSYEPAGQQFPERSIPAGESKNGNSRRHSITAPKAQRSRCSERSPAEISLDALIL